MNMMNIKIPCIPHFCNHITHNRMIHICQSKRNVT